ncbi:hypothetical protein Sjap_012662 [Stephania japonica]|uniref:Lipoxygenase n=1 Tax=Stephania japonica TaxID=461633 RepID=A0AAP0IXM5_9MAGN
MLKPQLINSTKSSSHALSLLHNKPLFSSSIAPFHQTKTGLIHKTNYGTVVAVSSGNTVKPSTVAAPLECETVSYEEKVVTVKAEVSVKLPTVKFLSNISVAPLIDGVADLVGKTLLLELVSSELDPQTGEERETIKGFAHKTINDEDRQNNDDEKEKGQTVRYEAKFEVPKNFGRIGAVVVENEHHREMFLAHIVLDGLLNSPPVTIICNSWVSSKFDNPQRRVFFTKKCYLPGQTPSGLKKLREEELENLRGDGTKKRELFERVYDYDKYNDLGDPDTSDELARPILGGPEHPYPRRCRTGREPTKKDPLCERRSKSRNIYVPRDEAFSQVKQSQFSAKTLRSVLHAVVPSLKTALNSKPEFPHFTAIDSLYDQGLSLPKLEKEGQGFFKKALPRLIKAIKGDNILLYETPELMNRNKFAWLKDEEFSRQMLAGVNPCNIQLVTEWPLKSKLDPTIYGPAESAITKEIVERQIKGIMTVEEALENKRLFVLDYHDMLLPYVNKIRDLPGTTMYASRTLFFLLDDNTLRPLAIELTRPPKEDKPQWRNVYTPGWDGTTNWLWKFAKVHVCAHDAGIHELVSHWVRTHACTEPCVIATNRQLSAMHPVYRLLHPHLRYTMEINALARDALINAKGVIEASFAPGKYSLELSSAAYDKLWRFDMEGLPADLIRRGMAVEDPTAEHGLKLTIKDYPFATDGLLIWAAIKDWVTDNVNHYYPEQSLVETDTELQSWWTEIRVKGHEDKKDEPWWPTLKTPDDLIHILTTIIWVASGHHAAVNFGQYAYGGYFPNRPTIARTDMPDDNPTEDEFWSFLEKPEMAILQCFPSQIQAASVMAVLDVLSCHSPDEEYLGDIKALNQWDGNPEIKAAYERLCGKVKQIEGIIDARNRDLSLKNRCGAGVVPYELLKPFSKPGVTGMGVPNSISI